MSLSPLPPSSTLLLLLAPVFPPIHPPAFYSSKGVEEFAAKINEFIFTHHPSSSAAWGRAVQLMTVEEGGRGGLQAQPEGIAWRVLLGRSGGYVASVVPLLWDVLRMWCQQWCVESEGSPGCGR